MFWSELFSWLSGLASGTNERIGLTVAVVVSVLAVRIIVGQWRGSREDVSSRMRLAQSTSVAIATAVGVIALIGIWSLGGDLVESLRSLDLGAQLTNLLLAVIILGGAYVVTDFFGMVIKEVASDQTSITQHQEEVVRRTMQLTVYALSLLLVVGLFTDNVGGLLVGAGFLGIVVGMAARQTLGAVLAGFVLMFSRPFQVGDWVQIGDHEGTVTEITIINTRLRSLDGEYVTIPNDEVRSQAVVDRSWRDRLRIEVEVGVDYDADPEHAADVALGALGDVDGAMTVPKPAVVAKRFGDSAIVLGVRYWIENPSARKRWKTQTDVIGRVKAAFEEAGIDIPYPQQEISARNGGAGSAVSLGERVDGAESDPEPEPEPESEPTSAASGGGDQ